MQAILESLGQAKQLVHIEPKKHYGKPAKTPCREHKGKRGPRNTQARTHCLCLPECVHNGTPLFSHHTVVPQPGFWVDGLTDTPQHLQRLPAVPAERRGLAGAQQATERSSCEPAAQQSLQEPLGYPNCTWGFQAWFRPFSVLFHGGRKETSVILVSPFQSPTWFCSFPSLGQAAACRGALCPAPLCELWVRGRENLQSLSLAAAYGERGRPAQKCHNEFSAGSAEVWPVYCCVEGRRSWSVQKIRWASCCSERKLGPLVPTWEPLAVPESGIPMPLETGTHFLTGSSPCFISSRIAVGAV